MSYKYIVYEKKDRVAYITLNRPEVMNALHPPANEELWNACCDFRDDSEVWVAILTGAGDRAFCTGQDLRYAARAAEHRPLLPPGGFGAITNRFECYKPIIAALNGYAIGGGLEIALACDIIVAAEHSRFGLTEPTVGRIAGAGGIQRLPRQIPFKIAMGMLLTGRQITTDEAYRIGLVNEIVPLQELIPCAERWAADILRCAPLSVQASKQGALQGMDLPLEAAINNNYYLFQKTRLSEDYVEGARAFVEKRKPQWKGR